jgi:HEPN domain-containing protein
MRLRKVLKMNRVLFMILIAIFAVSCKDYNKQVKRIPVAKAGNEILYRDQILNLVEPGTPKADSAVIIQNYINKWAKRVLLFQKAEDNLSPELKDEIENQLEETRENLVIYQYQREMMLEKMDTVLTEAELENYYAANEKSFVLGSNIVKALFIKIPVETPNIYRIRQLARSVEQTDLQQLETLCYQFAEKFDDFNEEWVPMDRLTVELPVDIENEEYFLRRTKLFETNDADSTFLFLITIRDYRLRSSLAPYEYVKEDVKRIIWNNRRFGFIQSLENGIYNEALKENIFKIY